MLGLRKEVKTEEEIAKALSKKRDECIAKSAKLQFLINADNTGWQDYINLLDEYIGACKKRKAITALDRASEQVIKEIQLLDHEIFILSWAKEIPGQFIKKTKELSEPKGETDAAE